MLHERRMIVAARKPAECRLPAQPQPEYPALGTEQGIIGVQHQQSFVIEQVSDTELDVREAVEVINAVFAEVIGTDVGDDGHVRAICCETAAQDAAPGRLEDGCIHARVAEHEASSCRTRVIARRHRLAVDEDAVRAIEAVTPAMSACAGSDESHRGGLAVRSGDGGDRDGVQRRPRHLVDGRQRVE
jgi:hypothetical protein